jgi:hypothetical protein
MFGVVFFVIAAVCFFGALLQQAGLIATMRSHHGEYYKRLGEPSWYVFLPWEILPSMSFLSYIIFAEFKTDDAPKELIPALKSARLWYLAGIGFAIVALAGSSIFASN